MTTSVVVTGTGQAPSQPCQKCLVIGAGGSTLSIRGGAAMTIPASTVPFMVEQISNTSDLVFGGTVTSIGLIAY